MATKAPEEELENNFDRISVEALHTLYEKGELLRVPYKLYRLTSVRGRVYIEFDENMENPILYMGATSVSKEIPESEP